MRSARSALAKLALGLSSVLFTLGLAEGGLRLAGYEAIYEVYSKPSLFWTADELLGWRHEPNVSGTYVGPRPWPVEFRTPVRINSLGLRGPELPELPEGGIRVLVLGDSFVAGFEVEWEKTYPALIEKALGRRLGFPVQVINAGVRGYGTDQSLLYYREHGHELSPHLVVMVHSRNDNEDNATLHRMRRPFGKPAFSLGEDGTLDLVGHPVPDYPLCSHFGLDEAYRPARLDGLAGRGLCRLQTGLSDHSALFTFLTLRIQRNPGILRWLYELAEARPAGSDPLRAGLPPLVRASARAFLSDPKRSALTTALYRRLAADVRRDGAGFLAVIGFLGLRDFDRVALAGDGIWVHEIRMRPPPQGPEAMHFVNDGHYNELGHRMLAENLTPAFADAIARIRAGRR